MITLNDFLKVPYVDHGRDLDGLDCYGQVFLARSLLFKRPLNGDYSHIHPDDKAAMTAVYFECLPNFELVTTPTPPPGAIGGCFKKDAAGNDVLLHVGLVVVVDGQTKILNTGRESGPELMPLRAFKRLALDVRFYDDRHDKNLS
ncbi:MAG: phage tail protein [Alteromonas sp.]|nr:phage tail protein [Alteromonas sp.]